MHPRGPLPAFLLVLLTLTMGLVAGCGGEQSGNGSQGDASGGTKKQGGEGAKPEISAPKIALGTVTRVNTEARTIFLRPSAEEQGKKPPHFKVRKDATITLDNKEAELSDAEKGQQAQITYVVRLGNERNEHRLPQVAREVALISDGGAGSGGGEKTG